MYHTLNEVLKQVDFNTIIASRKQELLPLITYIQAKKNGGEEINLNFICTHNSRRSQFSQVWAKVAAAKYGITINAFSAGVEVTAFNERAIESLKRFGFKITAEGTVNPKYTIEFDSTHDEVVAFSKLIEAEVNPTQNFAAIMTCAHADENCPIVTGCEERIPIRYNDPKKYDNSPLEKAMYDYRSFEIATELLYVFSEVG